MLQDFCVFVNQFEHGIEMNEIENQRAYAAAAIQQRGGWLAKELATLKRQPVEDSIHDTRVQSRRMRAALESFQDLFPSQLWQDLYDSIRHITRTLGETRETEVMLGLLEQLTSPGDAGENLCREFLDLKLEKKLKKLKRKLDDRLREIDVRVLRSRIRHLLAHSSSAATQAGEAVPPPVLTDNLDRVRATLSVLVQPILGFRNQSFPRASDRRLHKLRIATKKLRYAMEIFDVLWPGGLKRQIAPARALQDAAGAHQDWAVLKLFLQKEIRRLTKGNKPYLASQTEQLLARAEEKKAEVRATILPALTELQQSLQPVVEAKLGRGGR